MRPTKTYDQERAQFNLARLRKAGVEYEIVIDPDKAIAYKEGEKVDLEEVLLAEDVFFDAKKGEHASEERMQEVFGTADPLVIAALILKEGEIQLTAEHRAKVRENKRKRLVQLIARNACDPKTKLPHPLARIEHAMEEAKVRVDEFKKPEDQVQDVIKQLRVVLPISVELRVAGVHIPAVHAGKAYGAVQGFGKVRKEEWLNDGSWKAELELPAGLVNELIDKLNNMTHGSTTVDIIK
ncbi:ribosome assembly factor SBDS [Candidatus Woesearchaeota archaeon]|nr:ribosome assembly factor SBDS [Candidatus Woesearchaeota archaeon]